MLSVTLLRSNDGLKKVRCLSFRHADLCTTVRTLLQACVLRGVR
jgi:hypothetical protein